MVCYKSQDSKACFSYIFFFKDEVSNIKFEELVRKEFRKQGMEPVLIGFILIVIVLLRKKV